jgi:CRP-like cAMP-binding protein
MAAIDVLKTSALFKAISDADLHRLAGSCQLRSAIVGEVLFNEGEKSSSLFLIQGGTVGIGKMGSGGDEAVTHVGAGSHFGEMGMLESNVKRSATATVQEATQLLEIPYEAIDSMVQSSPQAGMIFYKNLASNLAGRIRRTTEDLTGLRGLRLRSL